MLSLALAALIVFVILCASEFGWRKQWLTGEFGRKFIHVTVGSFVAFWPFFMSWNEIRIASVAFLVVVALSKYLHVFSAIHSVQRPTYGEIFFALVVGLLTFVTHSKGVYTASLLQMSLADGLAAVVGTSWGGSTRYHLLGHTKSVVGTVTFLATSLVILLGYSLFDTSGLPIMLVVFGAAAATILENLGGFGIDNLLVPLFIAVLLTRL